MKKTFRVSSSHVEDFDTGQTGEPGEVVELDTDADHNKLLIEDGRLQELPSDQQLNKEESESESESETPPTRSPKSKINEKDGGS